MSVCHFSKFRFVRKLTSLGSIDLELYRALCCSLARSADRVACGRLDAGGVACGDGSGWVPPESGQNGRSAIELLCRHSEKMSSLYSTERSTANSPEGF